MNYLQNTLNSLSSSLGDYLPNTIAAILILIIGSLIAGFIKRLITKLIKRTKIDDRLSSDKMKLSSFIGKLVYFLAMIFVFMLALEKLGMTNVLDPVKNLLNNFLAFVPNIVGAGLVGYIGYMLATIVSELVGLSGDTIQNFVPKLRLPNNLNLVGILKKLVFIFIFIPMLITALNILNMDTISEPATVMLEQFFAAIPRILVAVIILIFFVVGGRFVSQLLSDLLENLKINELLNNMNLEGITAKTNIPKLVGNLAFFFIVLFGLMTAIEKLEFISGIAYKSLSKSNNNQFVASILRICVLAIFLAMGLKTMGIGDEIINMAFGITLATVAITIALSFGLGGRAAAGKQMERILDKFNQKK